jgi:hypothetical protein
MVSPMNRWSLPKALAVASIVVVALFVVDRPSGRSVPDIRGSVPMGDYQDRRWVQPLLDAGFCVDFGYDAQASSFARDGHFESVSDSYVIGREIPEPGARLLAGSTVTVIVGGSSMIGSMDWDSVPLVCPSDRV